MTTMAELLADKTVLIVEDDVLISTYVGDLFSDLGCTSVVTEFNLSTAIDELKTGKPSLALLD